MGLGELESSLGGGAEQVIYLSYNRREIVMITDHVYTQFDVIISVQFFYH